MLARSLLGTHLRRSGGAPLWCLGSVRPFTSEGTKDTSFSYTPPGRNHLFVPGPVNIPERVVRAMIRPSENHRDPYFGPFLEPIFDELKKLYKSKEGTCFIFPSTGTGAWEAGLTNTLSPGDKVVAFRYGQFSHLWCEQARRLGLDVIKVERPWGEGADEAALQQILADDKKHDIKAVMVVHNETTTGVTSDIKGCREAMDAAGHPALLMVDGVSSIGALDFRFDEWRVDVAMTGSQKALSMPTGLGLCCVSNKALEASKTATLPRFFFSFDDMIATNKELNFPYTPSIPLLHGLKEALACISDEGLDNVIARHARLAEGTRRAVDAWGLKLLCKHPRWNSNSLSVIEVPPGIDSNMIVKTAYCKYNLTIGVGLSEVNGKVFRIGHLGDMNEVSMLGAIAGVEMAMRDCGIKSFEFGAGVGAAAKYWQETSSVIRSREII